MIEKYVFIIKEDENMKKASSIAKEDELLSEVGNIWTIQHIEIPFLPLCFKGYIINDSVILTDDVTPMVDNIGGELTEVDKVGMMKANVKYNEQSVEYAIDIYHVIYINLDRFQELFGNKFLVNDDREIIYYPQGVSQ